MIISIEHEMVVFWAAFLCAQIICIAFDLSRVLRHYLQNKKIILSLIDAVFCLFSFKVFFDICYITNNGRLRWYIFASFFLSCILYFFAQSHFVRRLFFSMARLAGFIIRPVLGLLTSAVGFIKSQLIVPSKTYLLGVFSHIKSIFRQITTKKHPQSQENEDLI